MIHLASRDKRIPVGFPKEHPIWSYPNGQRAARVKELVDIGLSFEEKFLIILEKLERMEEFIKLIANGNHCEQQRKKPRVTLDPRDFADI
ncbi:MAG: hypothetical protein QHH75_10455 [Bacillota bacterium]|nr:hypothetical protein [Bacillota bacterium]